MNLRLARKIAGLTQQQLAKRAGVDNSFISLIESGKRDIRGAGYETVVRLARALRVHPEELWPVDTLPVPPPRKRRRRSEAAS